MVNCVNISSMVLIDYLCGDAKDEVLCRPDLVLQCTVAKDYQGLALCHRGCCVFYALMQPNESSAIFSKSLPLRLHPRIELGVQRRHGLQRPKHSPQQRHQGPQVPTNLIRATQHFILRISTKVINQHHRSLLPLRHTTLSHKHIKVSQPLIDSWVAG